MKKILLIILGVLVVLIIIGGGVWYFIENKPIACTEEAKICPDGIAVGRTGKNCEFAECPIIEDETADWKTYKNEEYGFEVKYPTGWTVEVADNTNGGGPIIAGFYFSYPHVIQLPNGGSAVDQSAWGIQIFNKNNVTNDLGTKLEHGDKAYVIFNEGLQPELFARFLSTFKFIEPIDISNWKTYRNEEYGFEFKYPKDFIVFEDINKVGFINSNWTNAKSPQFGVYVYSSERAHILQEKTKYSKDEYASKIISESNVGVWYFSDQTDYAKNRENRAIHALSTVWVDDKNSEQATIGDLSMTPAVIVSNNGIYEIFFEQESVDALRIFNDEKQIDQKILSTFKFIE